MNKWDTWSDIDWKVVERQVFKLQKRIYKASQRGDVKLVHKLQRLLINSYYGKLLAVRGVSQDNQGKKKAGVDDIKSLNPKQRFEMVNKLKLGNKTKPTPRAWIPKPKIEKRPLGIASMYDRALQCLVKLALEPEWEAKFEPNSYGFRPGRSDQDAIGAIFNAIRFKPKYILVGKISKCFAKINHKALLDKLQTFSVLRKQVKSWLQCSVLDNGELFPTDEGTPQGGEVYSLLANIVLHGMENEIKAYARTLKGHKRDHEFALSLIRYADDLVIIHEDLNVIKKSQEIAQKWLSQYGLEFKPSKTKISHTLTEHDGNVGFDFLGFTIRQFPVGKHQSGNNTNGEKLGFKTIIKPSKEHIKLHSKKTGKIIRKHRSSTQEELIKELNPIIRGWSNYYATVCSKEEFAYCDHILYQQLKRWGERKHSNKSKGWIVNKYWHTQGKRNWVFGTGKKGSVKLIQHQDTKIVKHRKVKGEKSPFDGDWKYWGGILSNDLKTPQEKVSLLRKQKGKCASCGLHLKNGDLLEIDHKIPQITKWEK